LCYNAIKCICNTYIPKPSIYSSFYFIRCACLSKLESLILVFAKRKDYDDDDESLLPYTIDKKTIEANA